MYLNELAGDPIEWTTTPVHKVIPTAQQIPVRVVAGKLMITLKAAAWITVSRIDISGRTVDVLHDAILPAGSTGISLNKKASGMTFLMVKGNGIDFILREIVVR